MSGSFTQFSFGNSGAGATSAIGSNISPISFEALSPERINEVRLQMISQLQTTLDIEQILTIFHRHLKQHLTVSGIQYLNGDHMIETITGHTAKHRASYQLTLQNNDYGSIVFTRNKRFSEKELMFLETVMDVVMFPLRNAIKYREALATAMIDPLTGLNNRGAMAITLNREMERARRHEDQNLSIVLIDVDHFKAINDRYGHLAGDDILRQVAHVIQKSIRGSDACFRFGGEEFLVCVANSNLPLARMVAERIRIAISDQVRLPDKERSISASFGIAHYQNESDWPELVARADKALYAAKSQGRNCVVTSADHPSVNAG